MGSGGTARTMLGASGLTVLGCLGPFLLGAQAVLMQQDLGFGPARLGLGVSVFFGVAALSTILGIGAFTRLGRRVGLVTAGGLVGSGGLFIATVADGWWALALGMAVLGLANAACQGTANAAVSTALPQHRRGLGFGIKQSAVPLAIMFGGLAVPTTTVLFGWRSTYLIIGLVGMVVATVGLLRRVPEPAPAPRGQRGPPADRAPVRPLVMCGLSMMFANAGANFSGAYLASWAYGVGLTVEEAGLLLAVGAGSSALARVLVGHGADRRHGRNLPVVAGLMLSGAGCLAILGAVPQVWTVLIFGSLAFAVGWSWPGLLLYAVARLGRDAPAQASSLVQAGAFAGGALGPAAYGLVVALIGFQAGWFVASASFVLAAVLLLIARRGFLRDLQVRPPVTPFGYGGGHDRPRYTTRSPDTSPEENTMLITALDHLVMTCSDVDRTIDWYTRVLELPVITYGPGRRALLVGRQKINLRPAVGSDDWVTGATSTPGDQDLCFLTDLSPQQVLERLAALGVEVTNGPITRDGARGTLRSVYCLDPDGSLVEISSYE